MLIIKKHKDPVLFKKAVPVALNEFGESLDKYLSEMAQLMYSSQGVGLAAPQVGDSRRMLVADLGYVEGKEYGSDLIKMVNPEIISYSEETTMAEEGCLSYPGLAIKVERPVAIFVKFFSPFGEAQERTFKDWQARVISHEISHLDGDTLYTRASSFARGRYDQKIKKGK